MPKQKLLIATGNAGKIAELKEIFADLPFELVTLSEQVPIDPPNENGETFLENARIKAIHYAVNTGLAAVADDSGLEVVALNGAPGIFSARFAGERTPYAEKIRALLNAIDESHNQDRSARFVCAMAVASPSGNIQYEAVATCDGSIAIEPVGSLGFGYDPIFIPEAFDKTFGELGESVKHKVGHRARAAIKIIRFLRDSA